MSRNTLLLTTAQVKAIHAALVDYKYILENEDVSLPEGFDQKAFEAGTKVFADLLITLGVLPYDYHDPQHTA